VRVASSAPGKPGANPVKALRADHRLPSGGPIVRLLEGQFKEGDTITVDQHEGFFTFA
jgi:hypothetical protein